MTRHRMRAAIVVGAGLALASCQPASVPDQNRAELEGLHAAHDCWPDLPIFGRFPGGGWNEVIYKPPKGSITMGNDGGWCWIQTVEQFGQKVFTPELDVTQPPAHGAVVVGSVADKLRIAYRPTPGYVGPDSFHVHLGGPTPWDIPVQVTVRQ